MAKIVVIGASGLIGSHVVAALAARGHQIAGLARNVQPLPLNLPALHWISLDLGRAGPAAWQPILVGTHAVINCAGALQSGPADDLSATHDQGLHALLAACEAAGVPRLIHFSAMGVDQSSPTEFSRSKLAGDAGVMASPLDWVILRPSVVLGPAAYGASALIRSLAAFPLLPVMPDTGPLRPVALEDVVATVVFFLAPDAPARVTVDLAGPEEMGFSEIVRLYRRWLGYRPARELHLPRWTAGLLYRIGDFAGRLGWRPPVRSTARREIARGAAVESTNWKAITGVTPRSIAAMLDARPASVQERWFAGLYLLKPALLASLALFWIGSGLASLGPGRGAGMAMMHEAGAGGWALLAVLGGGMADLLVGVGIALRRTARAALLAGIAIALLYAVAGSIVTPRLWLDPLAPLLKIAPVVALHLVALATLRDR